MRWIVIDLDEQQGEYQFLFFNKKEAQKQVKEWRWCDALTEGHPHKYIIVKEDEI